MTLDNLDIWEAYHDQQDEEEYLRWCARRITRARRAALDRLPSYANERATPARVSADTTTTKGK